MPTCEHGHETNIFITEDTHDCKTCGVCKFLEAEDRSHAKVGVAGNAEKVADVPLSPRPMGQINSAPTNDDLLDSLTDCVLEYAKVDGLPTSHRNPEECPDVDVVIPNKDREDLRAEMSGIMKEWVGQIFRKKRGDDPKGE